MGVSVAVSVTVGGPLPGDLSGSVQIANVSSQTSGLYRCSAANLLGTENCYINLSIYSGGRPRPRPRPSPTTPPLSVRVGGLNLWLVSPQPRAAPRASRRPCC